MNPKTIELILSELMLATSGVIKKYGNPTVHPPEANKELDEAFHEALAQIQQLLEECAPIKRTVIKDESLTSAGEQVRYRSLGFNQAIDQYKSNLMEKLR